MSDWKIDSDIYDIVDSVKNVQKRYIEDEDETTLSLGVFGFIADTEAKKIQTATIMAGQLGNEMFPTRANLTKNVLAHATFNGITDINATPAKITVTLCVKLSDIDKYLKDNYFYIEALAPIFIGSYEFHLDYDVKIKKIKVSDNSYSYSAQYITTDENDNKIINRLSDITNPYLVQPFILNIDGNQYIAVQCTIRQYSIEETNDTMTSDSIIENKSYSFEYTNQMADFRVVITDNGEETEITPYMYGSVIDPEEENYCWYQFVADNTVRITFDSLSYIPGLNSQIYIRAYTTLGASGNFEYLNIDGNSEGLYVDIKASNTSFTTYNNIISYLVAVTDSTDGADKKTKAELKKLIPKAAMSRGNITTETDLDNYFNLINTDSNRLVMQKKVDNQLNRVWYGYFLLKDDNGNIIPSNTIDIRVDVSNSSFVTQSADGRYIIPACTYLKYDPSTGYATPIDEAKIPESYSDSYFDSGFYYYCTYYNIVLSADPVYAAYYLMVTNHYSYFVYDYVNEACNTQFIANRFSFARNFITDRSDYKMSFSIAQSILGSNDPLIKTETITITNDDGTTTEKEVTTENLVVILVLYKNGSAYRWAKCTYTGSYDSSQSSGIYPFEVTFTTDDMMDDNNDLKIIGGNEYGSTVAMPGYFPETTEASIYILANIATTSAIDYPRKDLDSIAPGYEDYTVTNIYKAVVGLDFFDNYTNITNTKVTQLTNTVYNITGVPCIGRHYLNSVTDANFAIEAIKEKKQYIDYCLELIENSMNIDFKFFNTYGQSVTYMLEDGKTSIGNIDITMRFKLSLRDSTDLTTKTDIIAAIKAYIEDLNDIGDLHIPNLITDIINTYSDRIYFIEFVGFNGYDTDDQHIIKVDDDNPLTVPEFINVRNTIDEATTELVPKIDITLV